MPPLDSVGPGTPEAILPMPEEYPRNRLGLAQWLMDPRNPLTARVAVNRFWQIIFGEGLVHTPEDFGSQAPCLPIRSSWITLRTHSSARDGTSRHCCLTSSLRPHIASPMRCHQGWRGRTPTTYT